MKNPKMIQLKRIHITSQTPNHVQMTVEMTVEMTKIVTTSQR